MTEKLHWAPKVSRSKVWQLYQSDARGALDEDLLAEVGYSLKQRCESILLASRRQVECPRCQAVFSLPEKSWMAPVVCPAPGCGWSISYEAYHNTWRHQDLLAASKAIEAVEEYLREWVRVATPTEKMFRIDRLLHTFHWDAHLDLPNRSFANNLLQGSHLQVIEFLDRLSFGDDPAAKQRWRETIDVMLKRRRGILP